MFKIYDFENFNKLKIYIPDFYFSSNYGKVCEISDNGIWKCIVYNNGEILIPFIEKNININNKKVIHLISNYGYGGIFIKDNQNISMFIEKLKKFMIKNNYITHFLRFTPYFKNNYNYELWSFNNSKIILKSNTYGINFNNTSYDKYIKGTKKNHRRSLKKANNKLYFKLRNFDEEDINGSFQKIYKETMDRVKSNKYYYFSNEYFKRLYDYCRNYVFIAEAILKDTKEVIASAIIFHWNNKYLHYHLGGSKTKYLKLCPNNFLHDNIIKYGFKNKYELYHIGGGLNNNDSLDLFKKSFSNICFSYYQGNIIYNFDKYIENCKYVSNIKNKYFPIYING